MAKSVTAVNVIETLQSETLHCCLANQQVEVLCVHIEVQNPIESMFLDYLS